jgi:SAM-dependent methyltransferase
VPLLERKWYYTIEIAPGVFTPGHEFDNVHLTRTALRGTDVSGLDCLDVGSMECLIPILLSRRGARRTLAYDRLNFSDRVAFLKDTLHVDFEYLHGFRMSELSSHLALRSARLFDLVVFSGVLYHMLNPTEGLLTARRVLRNGGIMIVETAAVINEEVCLYFNSNGRFFEGDNFWIPSLSCLDYLLRFVRLKPLDCSYFKLANRIPSRLALCRVCVPCLAVDHPVAEEGDEWIVLAQDRDFREHLDWKLVQDHARPPLAYEPSALRALRADGSVDVLATVMCSPETRSTNPKRELRLPLDALY